MGSLRNPVGPLPSSIYWRRRAVMLSVLALLVLFLVWAVTSSSGGGGKPEASGENGKHPTSSITPGPSGTGPAISQHPGGRDESDDEGGSGTAGSSGSDGSSDDEGAGSDGGDGSGSSGKPIKAGSGTSLPNCTADMTKLGVRSVHNSYAPGESPAFRLSAVNSSDKDCKVDLGPKKAVLTITQSSSDNTIWSSADCPSGAGSVLYRVPAGGRAALTVKWDRKPSAPNCATPPAGSAKAGTYLVEAKAPGFPSVPTSFVLSKD
ncbi:hypothetical protein AB0L85_26115 [Streptomyces sp. NPDC052051]|uniref:hypothetical protein n=1 Tax=Streptomyces sp. NPDC052051 TaxID=3154649 RepID=UPI0034383F89